MTVQLTRPQPGGESPVRERAAAPLDAIRWQWAAEFFAACALFAGAVALVSANPPQRLWGVLAAGAYGAAAVAVAAWRRHGMRLALAVAGGGGPLAPLGPMGARR